VAEKDNVRMGGGIRTTAEAVEDAALPEAYSVQITAGGELRASRDPGPEAFGRKPRPHKSEAEWAYERIVLYIQRFEQDLDNDHEVGMGLVGSDAGTLRIQGMGYFPPDMVTFYGTSDTGARMQMIQHVHQLNVLLVSQPKVDRQQAPNRIGFQLAAKLSDPEPEE
jgi:hypothetical protein